MRVRVRLLRRSGRASNDDPPRAQARVECLVPTWSKAGKRVALEAASSSTQGGGWARVGPVSPLLALGPLELPGVAYGGAGADLGHCRDCTLTMLLCISFVLTAAVRVASHPSAWIFSPGQG